MTLLLAMLLLPLAFFGSQLLLASLKILSSLLLLLANIPSTGVSTSAGVDVAALVALTAVDIPGILDVELFCCSSYFFVGIPAVDGSPTVVNIPFVIRVSTNSGVPDVPVISCAVVGPAIAVFRSAVLAYHSWGLCC